MLNQSKKKLAKVLDTTKFIMSKRQSPNLKKILTSAALPKTIQGSSTKCGDKRCGTCSYIYECETFIFKNQKTFQIRHPMNCKSKNLIYVMTCNGCGEHYIGQTGDKLCTEWPCTIIKFVIPARVSSLWAIIWKLATGTLGNYSSWWCPFWKLIVTIKPKELRPKIGL